MAKKIKAIKCPQCGGTKTRELRTDYYRCNSCSTEFYLDSDDININHYHHNAPPATGVNPLRGKKLAYTILAVSGIMLLMFFLPLLFRKSPGSSILEEKEQWNSAAVFALETPKGQSVFVKTGIMRGRNYNEKSHPVKMAFYDAKTMKEIKKIELPLSVERFDAKFKYFSDGTLYFIVNDKKLFTIDRQMLSAAEVSPDSYKDIRGLESGFAKIEYGFDLEDDHFRIMSNQGKELYYYPIIRKSFIGYDEHVNAERSPNLMPANSPVITRFVFSAKSSDFREEIQQLIKYQAKLTAGYPVGGALFAWDKTWEGEKVLIDKHWKEWARIVAFEDFTPGRLYFAPEVLGFNDQQVIINYKPTPAEDEKFILQALNAKTAEVLWSANTNRNYSYGSALITKDGIFCMTNSEAIFYNFSGKEISSIERN